MANDRFIGRAQAVAKVITVTCLATNSSTYTVAINTKSYSYTSDGSATVAEISAGLIALLQAAPDGEFKELTFADLVGTFTATMNTAGKDFTLTLSTAATANRLTQATTTALSSPGDPGDVHNWSTGSLPVDGDSCFWDGMDQPMTTNLTALAAVNPALMQFSSTFTGPIGLPERTGSASSTTAYEEFRPRYFQTGGGSGTIVINVGDTLGGQGSPLIMLDTQASQTTLTVHSTGNSSDSSGLHALIWKGTHASNTLTVENGSIDVAPFGGETAVVAAVVVNNGNVRTSSGVTLTTVTQAGGTLDTASAITTLTQKGGTHTHRAGNITTLTLTEGTLSLQPSAALTIAACNLGPAAVLDLSNCAVAVTLTNGTWKGGAVINDPADRLTFSNAISLPDGFNSVTLNRSKAAVSLQFS